MNETISFATCDRRRALLFLSKLYPSRTVADTPEDAGPLLDLVEKDIVRIQDPDFHPRAQIIPGTYWDESRRGEIFSICQAFHDGPKARDDEMKRHQTALGGKS